MKKSIRFMMIICLSAFVSPRLGVAEGEFLSLDPNIGVEVTTDKTTASVNEKIKLNYYLYTRYDTRYEGFESYPSFRGFSIDAKPMDRDVPREIVKVKGKQYIKACIKEVILSPIYSGDLVLNPGVVKTTIAEETKTGSLFSVGDFVVNPRADKPKNGSFFVPRSTVLLELEPITIHVENPTGKSKMDFLAEFSSQHTAKTPLTIARIDKPAVIVLLDISGSMLAEDMQPQNRLASAKVAISKFLQENPEMMVGFKCFSKKVETISPLTQSKSEAVKALEGVQVASSEADGTAIGDAVFEATKELADFAGNKKAIILLTDGVNNSGQLEPLTAIDFASNGGILVNTIALGTKGLVPFPDPNMKNHTIMTEVGTDEQTLAEMAKETGGTFGVAKNEAELEVLLNEIQKTLAESK